MDKKYLEKIKHDINNSMLKQKIIFEMICQELDGKNQCDNALIVDLKESISLLTHDLQKFEKYLKIE